MFQFLFRNKKRAAVLLDPDEILVDSVSILGQGEYMEGKLERPLGRMSSFIFLFFMGGVFIFLISYAALLHIRRGDELFIRSQENRFFVRTILAPRGIIYDSSREPFVRNEPTFGILFERDAFRREGGGAIAAFMEHVRTVFGEKSDIPERFDFLKESTVLSSLQESVVIAREASSEDVVAVVAHSRELPGLKIFEGFRRNYADPNAYSHLLGFVGKASEEDLDKKPYLFSDVLIGKNGVESMYDAVLLGRQGKKIVEMDSLGRESRFKLIEKPQEGKSIVLTVDRALQSAAYEIFHKHIGEKRAGSVVILDASTGAVRALVSYPGFDSNKFGRTLLPQEFER
ncbi:MAG: hypothetical protein HYZ69_03100, partial [Candidatus Colwellbacteria bacterium]|nr:hypothetical protein [Candidatus Colwellbacteria bacterium]